MSYVVTKLPFSVLLLSSAFPVSVFGQWKPPATSNLPPEILKQMDPEILSGKRPRFAVLKQEDIFKLRESPRLDADFVRFSFDVRQLSSVQWDIVQNWIAAGYNPVYLEGEDLWMYASLVGAEYNRSFANDYDWPPWPKLVEHPVNTDCRRVAFDSGYSNKRDKWGNLAFQHHVYALSKLPPDSSTIAQMGDGQAVAGAIAVAEGRVYFRNRVSGTDFDRWILNYWHWALGLPVPGAADRTTGASSISTTLAEASKRDRITLKNGDTVTGDIRNEQFSIQTSYGLLKFARPEIARITLEGAGANVDVLKLRNGDKLSGVIQEASLKLALAAGEEAELEKDKIKEIRFRTVE